MTMTFNLTFDPVLFFAAGIYGYIIIDLLTDIKDELRKLNERSRK